MIKYHWTTFGNVVAMASKAGTIWVAFMKDPDSEKNTALLSSSLEEVATLTTGVMFFALSLWLEQEVSNKRTSVLKNYRRNQDLEQLLGEHATWERNSTNLGALCAAPTGVVGEAMSVNKLRLLDFRHEDYDDLLEENNGTTMLGDAVRVLFETKKFAYYSYTDLEWYKQWFTQQEIAAKHGGSSKAKFWPETFKLHEDGNVRNWDDMRWSNSKLCWVAKLSN